MDGIEKKATEMIKSWVEYIIVAAICVIYVATSIFKIDETGKTITQIVGDGLAAFLLGVTINRLFELKGLMQGDKDDRLVATYRLHGEMVMKITPKIDKLDDWCEKENKNNYRVERTKILARYGLKYEDCFDNDGVAKRYDVNMARMKESKYAKRDEKKKFKAYVKAQSLVLTPLTSSMLTSENGNQEDKYNLGKSKKDYATRSTTLDVVAKIVIAVVTGYYGVQQLENFSWADLLWKCLQIGVFLLMGIVKMYVSQQFVTDEYRARIIRKIDNLQKFALSENVQITEQKESTEV